MPSENRTIAKQQVDETPFQVVFAPDTRPQRPFCIGKHAVACDPLSYIEYTDTPSPEAGIEGMDSTLQLTMEKAHESASQTSMEEGEEKSGNKIIYSYKW